MKSILPGILILIYLTTGCAGLSIRDRGNGVLLWKSESRIPKWINYPTKDSNDSILFVGTSNKHSSESDAREDAYRDAIRNIAEYLELKVKTRYVNIAVGDNKLYVTEIFVDYLQILTNSLVLKAKAREYYIEKRRKEGNIYFKSHVLVEITKGAVDAAHRISCGDYLKRLKSKTDEKDILRKIDYIKNISDDSLF